MQTNPPSKIASLDLAPPLAVVLVSGEWAEAVSGMAPHLAGAGEDEGKELYRLR